MQFKNLIKNKVVKKELLIFKNL